MPTKNLVFKDSPFVPVVVMTSLVEVAASLIQIEGYDPAPAIATALSETMSIHLSFNLVPYPSSLESYATSAQDLKMLSLGYRYQLDTVLASAICKDIPKEQRFALLATIFKPSEDPLIWSLQANIRADLNATINLLNLDPSAAFIFDFLKKYPHSQNEYFLAGMEIASIFFFGLSTAVSEALPEQNWLTVWQGIDNT